MTSTSVAQHTTQPLNFGPEWLRALSTPDSATSVPTSSGSNSGNVFKFSATKYRYSKDEILALRANVSDRLTETTQNEIMENLKDVESVFRPTIMDPMLLTAPTAEETAKMNALSSYISGRTPGGAGRAGNNAQQSQADTRNNRGSSSMSNGRGGSSRGRAGRDNTYGANRGNNNNNSDDNGENGNTGEETSGSSWSRGGYHSRGNSFGNRIRSYDERDQPPTFRRGNNTRQTSEGWRRTRGDDDDDNNNEQNDDSPTAVNGSASWTSRGGQTRRGGGSSSSLDQRAKSNDKWSFSDDRPGPSNSYESNQQRNSGWRTNSSTSDRDFNSRRPLVKRDRMPEWMDDDDNNDDDNQLSNATFEQDGTFTRSSTVPQNDNNDQQKMKSKSVSDESLSQNNPVSARQEKDEEKIKSEKSIQQVDTAIINVPVASEPVVPQRTPPVQQSMPSWDDDFDHHHLATNIVESTLAEDHDYSPPISSHSKSRLLTMESNQSTAPIIPQQRASVIIDDKQWFYKDPQNTVQGPFSSADMERWFTAGYFNTHLPVKRLGETQFSTIDQLTKELGRLPFRTDVSSHPSTPVQKQQQPVASESQKFNQMAYTTSAASSNAFIEDYLMQQHQQQQQSRQNVQHPMLVNRQTSMPLAANDRKPISSPSNMSSQLQTYFNSQPPQSSSSSSSSSLFPSNLVTDPAILYQQQQLQRSMSTTNTQQSNSISYDDMQRAFRQLSSQSTSTNNASFFPSNASHPQQPSNDLMSRLSTAMQSHGKQQQDKLEEHRRQSHQRRELELERLKLFEQARLQREEEERRKMQEISNNRQINFDQLTKTIENKKNSMELDQFLAYQQSLQFQKEQQAKLEAQQAENVRLYQQHYREHPQQTTYKIPETVNWNRNPAQTNDSSQLLNFADIQKQEQEQERRSREAAAFAHQYPKSRPATNQTSAPWNGTNNMSNPSVQDIQRPVQNETRQQPIHHSASTPAWGSNFQQSPATQQSAFQWDNQQSSLSNKPTTTNSNKSSTPWSELKPTSPSIKTSGRMNDEPTKTEREVKRLFNTTRGQDALSKWAQRQFKDNLKDVDVPTLVQLLKDIDNAGEIIEYIQPYIGSVSKAKEFANDFLVKRNQLANAEPDLDNERLNELVMAPTSSNDNSGSGGDEGFQLASSNGQKKKAKKMKGQKIDGKQLGFMVNNRPEQRDDIDKVSM